MAKTVVKVHTQYNLINKIIMAEKISLNYGIYETDELMI